MKLSVIRTFCRSAFIPWLVCCAAARADAQTDPALLRDHPGIGVGLGFTDTGDADTSHPASFDLSAHLDVPLATAWRLRAEAGTARWSFTPLPGNGDESSATRVRLTRASLGLVHSVVPKRESSRLGVDAAGGLGLYKFGLPAGASAQFGVHAGVAFDYALRNRRVALGAELRMHAVGGPGASTPIRADILFVGVGALTARFTFP